MAAYNFQARFEEPILKQTKMHTIRATRKRKTKVGETLYLFTGQRTKRCRLLMKAICTKVETIGIFLLADDRVLVRIEGQPLDKSEREALALRDGFSSFAEMLKFWDGRLPFKGEIIHWNTSEALEFQRLVPSARNVRFFPGRSVTKKTAGGVP